MPDDSKTETVATAVIPPIRTRALVSSLGVSSLGAFFGLFFLQHGRQREHSTFFF